MIFCQFICKCLIMKKKKPLKGAIMMKSSLGFYIFLLGFLVLLPLAGYAQYRQTIRLNYLEPSCVERGLNKVIAKSQEVYGTGGAGGAGDYYEGSISPGAGNGIVYKDITVELTTLEGDTANPSARLYLFSSQRDREITLSRNNSELFDNYRVRVDKIDYRRKSVDVTIRQVGGSLSSTPSGGLHPPGLVSIQSDNRNSSISISADYQVDLANLIEWVKYWDQPSTVEYLKNKSSRSGSSSSGISSLEGTITLNDIDVLNRNYKENDELKARYERKEITFKDFETLSRKLELQRRELLNKAYTPLN